ncbi:External alternative NAD(P)H-ubiquinone oxidoreductase B1 [Hibiscus syriacus]|uniref:NADH:ubiquinone reductase (non-electrogenic) n=1 Tax=Hibiscus syriacus TaxID=106335 RepID=A0A6A2ZX91_HIBSY|nr:external alternative NAD(P)H-ubiquinone oxidoreductase B1, mitochondrial-like [Hibiscus syriacus]KAE8696614.1 External alternative NAD(P)H-ubiquinone oxidoreductase B1 [Hibiscus syriacus]
MAILSFFTRASRAFNGYPASSKLLLLCTLSLSGGGVVAYSESQADVIKTSVQVNEKDSKKKRVVVLGTGWAGISFLKDLDVSAYDVQVVSPRNYFAFTPLLPSVTCGTVEARSIVEPVRNMIKKRNGEIRFWEAECMKIDDANKKLLCRHTSENNLVGNDEFSLDYDYLVIAVGAQVNTFNTPGVLENCHFLKEVEDAQKIRRSVIDCFEKAVLPGLTEEERRINLHFVIVGGGPTGVEFAAELHDFVKEDLVNLYPSVKDLVKITVVQSGDHILNMFDERISCFAEQKFSRDGIDVQTGCRVISLSDKEITMKIKSTGEVCSVPHGLVVWSTGVETRPVVKDFMAQIGQANRRVLATDEWLRVKGSENVYALGDCATINQRKVMEDISAIFKAADKDNSGFLTIKEFEDVVDDILERYPQVKHYLRSKQMRDVTDLLKDPEGNKRDEVDIEGFKLALVHADTQLKNLPATAQVAAQQGEYLSKCFNRKYLSEDNPEGPRRFRGSGRHQFRPFQYKHFGQFAPLGGEQAAAELPGDWVSMGHSTQWLWYSVYASKQVSWRTRVLVVSDWTRRFIFGRDSSRI